MINLFLVLTPKKKASSSFSLALTCLKVETKLNFRYLIK